MTRLGPILLLVLAGCDLAGSAKTDDKADIQAIYDAVGRGVETRDIAAVSAYSLPSATTRFSDGTELTLDQWKEKARAGWASVRSTKSSIVVESVRTTGDATEATYTETHDMVVLDPAGGPDQAVGSTSRWKATLTKTADGWRISRSVELSRKVNRGGATVEEKPQDEPKP